MDEIWVQIDEFPNYSVSNKGRVRNDKFGRLVSVQLQGTRGASVMLSQQGKQHARSISRLYSNAFPPR